MIAQTIQTLVSEVNGLWSWVIGIVAGWGLTFTIVVATLVYAHVRITRLRQDLISIRNAYVTETRELSMRLRKLEK